MKKILIEGGPSEYGWSRISPFKLCERLFYLERERRAIEEGGMPGVRKTLVIPVYTDGPLARGSVGHVGMAHVLMRMKCEQEGTDPDQFYEPQEAMSLYATKHHIETEAFEPPMMALTAWDGESLARVKVLAVEKQDKAVIGRYADGTPMKLTTRWDGLISYFGSPKVYSIDHKFMARHGEETVSGRYTLSGQFLFQNLLGRAKFGPNWGGILIHAIGCFPPYKVAMYELEAAPAALRDFKASVVRTMLAIKEKDKVGYKAFDPAFHEQVCSTAYYSKCPYFDHCQWGT